MTGFLRRIVSGVVEGRAGPRPFVESSHAFVPRAEVPPAPAIDVQRVPTRLDARPFAPGLEPPDAVRFDPTPASISPRVERGGAPDSSTLPFPADGSPVRASGLAAFRPLLPEAPLEASAEASPTSGLTATDPSGTGAHETATREARPRGERAPSSPTMTPAPSREPRRDSRDAGRAAQRPSGGDDIQIHIGRIEVFAVPPPPRPAAPASPVRRGMSLDDHLRKHANRGAR
jgi:hypothetical protein